MRAIKTLFLLSLASGVAIGADLRDWKAIAGISSTDEISRIHVSNLLLSHDIESAIEGSVVYSISVPTTKAGEASQLLRTDARKRGYQVWFKTNDVVRAAKCRQVVSSSAISSVLEKSEYGSGTALGRFLRSERISQLAAKYPCVVSLSVHERKYLAAPNTYSTGYDIEIELQKSFHGDDDGYRGSYQVYDGGNRVGFLGSNEWKAARK